MSGRSWPRLLRPVTGPFLPARVSGVSEGMGAHAPVTRSLIDQGTASPDLVAGMSLVLLTGQPRTRSMDRTGRASATDGGVWVREQVTLHSPLSTTEQFVVTGSSMGQHVRRGRRYGTTAAQTRSVSGDLVATNLTTGLLEYKANVELEDSVEGVPLEEVRSPSPDHARVGSNPCRDALASATVGTVLGANPVMISLEMMRARDTDQPENPIHSDPGRAREAGLSQPIAGGSHVMAFALEPIMAAWGSEVLLHGTTIDVRWKAPTFCDSEIIATATLIDTTTDLVKLDIEVKLADGPTAMIGTVAIPR